MQSEAATRMFEHGSGIILQCQTRMRKDSQDLLAHQSVTGPHVQHVNFCVRRQRRQSEHLL